MTAQTATPAITQFDFDALLQGTVKRIIAGFVTVDYVRGEGTIVIGGVHTLHVCNTPLARLNAHVAGFAQNMAAA